MNKNILNIIYFLCIFAIIYLCVIYYYNMNKKPIYAIAVFNDNIKGTVKFTEDLPNKRIIIELNITGLKPNSLHGFHVHEAGDLTDKCTSMCAHFNPFTPLHI